MLSDGPEQRADTLETTPSVEGITPELPTLIRDDILGRATNPTHRLAKGPLNLLRGGTTEEDRKADQGTGEVIDHDGDPPTEGSGLW